MSFLNKWALHEFTYVVEPGIFFNFLLACKFDVLAEKFKPSGKTFSFWGRNIFCSLITILISFLIALTRNFFYFRFPAHLSLHMWLNPSSFVSIYFRHSQADDDSVVRRRKDSTRRDDILIQSGKSFHLHFGASHLRNQGRHANV